MQFNLLISSYMYIICAILFLLTFGCLTAFIVVVVVGRRCCYRVKQSLKIYTVNCTTTGKEKEADESIDEGTIIV